MYILTFYIVDADRAIYLLNAYKTKLRDPKEQSLRTAVDRVIAVFNSELFKSLIGLWLTCFLPIVCMQCMKPNFGNLGFERWCHPQWYRHADEAVCSKFGIYCFHRDCVAIGIVLIADWGPTWMHWPRGVGFYRSFLIANICCPNQNCSLN